MFFFFAAIPAVKGANPGQLKSSILLTRRASKFGGRPTFQQGVLFCARHLWARCVLFFIPSLLYPLSKGWLHLFGSQLVFPGPSYPLGKGWFFTCHCFLLFFHPGWSSWQKVAPAGFFPLFHTCFSCGVVRGYTLMPFINASCRISAVSSFKTLIPWLSRYSTLPLGPHLWSVLVMDSQPSQAPFSPQ